MTNERHQQVTITLRYTAGTDEPERGVFRNLPIEPTMASNLLIAIRQLEEDTPFPENPRQLQVHLIGTAEALEELGTYLIALSRLETADPEPYGSLDEVRNADGGTVRLLPRRVARLPVAR